MSILGWLRRDRSRRRASLACRDLVELLTDHLDGALSDIERRRVEGHLASCRHCATYLEQIRATVRVLARLGTDR